MLHFLLIYIWFYNYFLVKWSESHSVMSDSLLPHGLYSPWNSPTQNTGVDSLSLLRGIFPTQELNPGLHHCTWILYQLSHKGSPRILEWVAYPFSSVSSWPRNQMGVSCIADGYFTNWAIKKAHIIIPWFLPNRLQTDPYLPRIRTMTLTYYIFTFTERRAVYSQQMSRKCWWVNKRIIR